MPGAAADLTPREVAELAGAPKRAVEKAIEEGLLPVRSGRPRAGGRPRRLLPPEAVAYVAVLRRLGLALPPAYKRALLAALRRLRPDEARSARVRLGEAVELDLGRLLGDLMERVARYRAARDAHIACDPEILGGTPVIRGTRMTVYSVLGRVEHGDSIDAILEENPDLSREALEAAVTYARAHPPLGRPGGRPWAAAG